MTQRKIVLIGAGSASFTVGLVADLLASQIQAEWTVGLVDINEEALAVAEGLVRRMVQKTGRAVKVEASTDRCDMLPGADTIVSTIAVGGRDGWEADVVVPQKHGIFQPVGDTVGAGGISRALRQIPAMLDIARDVHRICPDAAFFNYANPMAAICRAINKHTEASVIGLCHGVQGTLRYLCGLIDVPYAQVRSLYVGMNHLTWITHFTRDGEDLWPLVCEKRASISPDDNPFSWELFDSYGAFPAVLDRHITEFFSERFAGGEYYGKKLGVDVMDILGVIRGGHERWQKMIRQSKGEEELDAGLFDRTAGEHEALIPILESMHFDRQEIFPMNVPNSTQAGVPPGFVLEMPVVAAKGGCLPVGMPPLEPGILAWVTEALYGVEITVEAAVRGDRRLLVQALLYDRCVPDLAAANALADDLLATHRANLPQFD